MDERTKFKNDVLKAARKHLSSRADIIGLDIKLTDISIDRQRFEIVGDKFKDSLVPVSISDFKHTLEIQVDSKIEVFGKEVVGSISFIKPKEGDIEMMDTTIEETTLTPDEARDFKNRGKKIKRILDIILAVLIAEAIHYAIEVVLGLLK